jgi:hypothetical protein
MRPPLIFALACHDLYEIGASNFSLSKIIAKKILSKNHCSFSVYNLLPASQHNFVSILPENIINIGKKIFFALGFVCSGINFRERKNV